MAHPYAGRVTPVLLLLLVAVIVFVLMINRSRSARMVDADLGPMQVAGQTMRCHHCEHTGFEQKNVQLNTAGMTLLGLDWANRQASCLICTNCGFIHWFQPQ